jgi:hypothetical protein
MTTFSISASWLVLLSLDFDFDLLFGDFSVCFDRDFCLEFDFVFDLDFCARITGSAFVFDLDLDAVALEGAATTRLEVDLDFCARITGSAFVFDLDLDAAVLEGAGTTRLEVGLNVRAGAAGVRTIGLELDCVFFNG